MHRKIALFSTFVGVGGRRKIIFNLQVINRRLRNYSQIACRLALLQENMSTLTKFWCKDYAPSCFSKKSTYIKTQRVSF